MPGFMPYDSMKLSFRGLHSERLEVHRGFARFNVKNIRTEIRPVPPDLSTDSRDPYLSCARRQHELNVGGLGPSVHMQQYPLSKIARSSVQKADCKMDPLRVPILRR